MEDRKTLAIVLTWYESLITRIQKHNYPGEARSDLLRSLNTFLEAGCSADAISKAIGPTARYDYYRKLTDYGAQIDIHRLARQLGEKFVWERLGGFIARGANINRLITMFPGDYVYNQPEFHHDYLVGKRTVCMLFGLNADPELVFALMEEWFIKQLRSDTLWQELDFFVDNGLDHDIVGVWLVEQLNRDSRFLFYSFEKSLSKEFAKYGVPLANFAEKFHENFGEYPDGYEPKDDDYGFDESQREPGEE